MDQTIATRSAHGLPVFGTVRSAYGLLWRHRWLHAKAIWPPVVFLVAAEFLYHRIFGNADGLAARWHALCAAPWWMPPLAIACWLAGLKFLLSFSISWRRHLLLGERFDPFFFRAPFWRYLGFLVLTYVWVVPLVLLSQVVAGLLVGAHAKTGAAIAAIVLGVPAVAFAIWAIVRQVPFFDALTLDKPHPGWRDGTRAMRGSVLRYVATFVLAMLPVVALNALLDIGLERAGADRHAVHVALGEAAFRQAMLFVHFSLGASIGVVTLLAVLPEVRRRATGADAKRLLGNG